MMLHRIQSDLSLLYTAKNQILLKTQSSNVVVAKLFLVINNIVTLVGTFEVCVAAHVALRMFIMQVQLPFLANRNAELAEPQGRN